MTKETRNLILFYAATLAATYLTYFTIVLLGLSPYALPGLILFLIGGSAPTWVGLLFVFFTFDKGQRAAYFKRLSPRLIPRRWWAIIFLLYPALFGIIYCVELLLGGSLPGMDALRAYLAQPWILPLGLFLALGSGPISEEFGWRGYALAPTMQRLGRINGTIVLGLIWGVWHLGLFFMPETWHGQLGFRFAGFPTFIIGSVGLSLLMTWIFVNTNGSILAAIFVHLMSNFTGTILAPHADRVEVIHAILLLVLGLGLCLVMERRQRRVPAVVAVS